MGDERFRHSVFSGTHAQVGEQHGEERRDEIQAHLDLIYATGMARSGLSRSQALELAESFVPFVERYSPGFAEEIAGIGRGAGIPPAEAMLLQVRQEVKHIARFAAAEAECTTFAVHGEWTRSGGAMAGQNADLSGPIEDFSAVVTFAVEGKPRVTMVIPAGQVSYIGMNSEGLAACANFLNSTGWRRGYPRYLLTRLALEQRKLSDAISAAMTPPRASSRNLLFASADGSMIDIETTAEHSAPIEADGGCLVHSNHYVSRDMVQHEASNENEMVDSCGRYTRMRELLERHRGDLTLEDVMTAYRDHANAPYSICLHAGEGRQGHTICSMIVELGAGRMHVARHPVCQNPYACYPA